MTGRPGGAAAAGQAWAPAPSPPCHTHPNPDIWWAPEDGTGTTPADADEAERICHEECPLGQQLSCLKGALANRELAGIWAGLRFPIDGRTLAAEVRALQARVLAEGRGAA